MATSRFPSFEPNTEKSWRIYEQKFKCHCAARKLREDAEQKAEFIACCSDEMFEFVEALSEKELLDDTLKFSDICTILQDHTKDPNNEIEASAIFHWRNQQPGESIKDFVAELRRLAKPCNFGDALERTLRDRIVLGITSVETRALLFRTKKADQTVTKVIEIARSVEASQRQALATAANAAPVHFMGRSRGQASGSGQSRQPQRSNGRASNTDGSSGAANSRSSNGGNKAKPCWRCEGSNHSPDTCKFKSFVCDFCNNEGHIQRACMKKRKKEGQHGGQSGGRGRRRGPESQALHATDVGHTPQTASAEPQQQQEEKLSYCEYAFFFAEVETISADMHKMAAKSGDSALALPPPIIKKMIIDGHAIEMEFDEGCPIALINYNVFVQKWPGIVLKKVPFNLSTWTAEAVNLNGYFMVSVKNGGHDVILPLFVGTGGGRALLGRQWFAPLGFRVIQEQTTPEPRVLYTAAAVGPEQPRPGNAPSDGRHAPAAVAGEPSRPGPVPAAPRQPEPFASVPEEWRRFECFKPGLGTYNGEPVHIEIDPKARPRIEAMRKVPFAKRKLVEQEIDRNVRLGVWSGPLSNTRWATAIVPVFSENRAPRLCGDYRTTVNLAIATDMYPMPTIEEAFSKLAGCTLFTKLDLKEAYTQVPVDAESARVLTVTTHKGLFAVHRLPFGVSIAPTLFQRMVATLLQDIDGVSVWLDDLLISGPDRATHDARLMEVLKRLSERGLRLHPEKSKFHQESVEYLGYEVDATGIRPRAKRAEAILNAPEPTNLGELRSFNGKLNFYDKFLPDRATKLEPLYRLLDQGRQWKWGEEERAAFNWAKQVLSSSPLLVHYDLNKPLVMSCDSSPYGIGAVLAHVYPDGSERPIEMASRTLSAAERNYSHVDKEALSPVFAVTKWHQLVAGRKITIFTDSKAVQGMYRRDRPFPAVLSPRVERWLIKMGCYDYEIVYRPGKLHGNADALSRLPVPGTEPLTVPEPPGIFLMSGTRSPHLTAEDIEEGTRRDLTLQRVMTWTQNGWPSQDPGGEFSVFFNRREALSCVRDCLLWGTRVVVPQALQQRALRHVHAAHMGIVRTKSLARVLFWWPGLSAQIEQLVNTCPSCQATKTGQKKLPVTPWPRADAPWSRLHVDYAGPFHGRHFLVVVDAHSGWADAFVTKGPTTEETIRCLDTSFRYNGLPFTLVSDNGSAFTSHRFRGYCAQRGIRQMFTAPRMPSSNGRAERMVGTIKRHLERLPEGDYQSKLDTILESLRATPGPDGETPSYRLMGRTVRTAITLVTPAPTVATPEVLHRYAIGDRVWYRHHGDPSWRPACVDAIKGAKMVRVNTPDGLVETRHVGQIRPRVSEEATQHVRVLLQQEPTPTGDGGHGDGGHGDGGRPDEQGPEAAAGGAHGRPRDGGIPEPDRRRSRGRGQPFSGSKEGERVPRSTRNSNPVYKV